MSGDIIRKGQGVTFENEMGDLIPMSFSENDQVNPFFLDPDTDGELIDQEKYPHKWPMEAAAIKLAHAILKGNPGQIEFSNALVLAKGLLNQSAKEFNRTADANHRIPAYFDENTLALNPEWARQNFGWYQDKKEHEGVGRSRRTKNAGGIVTFHLNNTPHPVFGHFPETGAFPSFSQLQDILYRWKKAGFPIPTNLVQYPHVEPQDMVTSGDGTDLYRPGPVKRHQTTDADPWGPYGQSFRERHTRQNVRVHDILAGLDPVFFNTRDAPYSEYAARQFRRLHGLNQEESEFLAATPAGAFWNLGRLRGERHALVKPTNTLKEGIMEIGGLTPEEMQRLIQSHVRGYRAVHMDDIGVSPKNGTHLLEALALSQIAREYGSHSEEDVAHPLARNAMNLISGPTTPVRLEPSEQIDRNVKTSHLRPQIPHNHSDFLDNISTPDEGSTPGEPRPGQTGRRMGEPLGQYAAGKVEAPVSTTIESSHDTLHSLMENLQMADARLDNQIMKSVPTYRDYHSIAEAYSISVNDVKIIEQSLGDWDRIAKSLIMSPLVVKGVKVSLG